MPESWQHINSLNIKRITFLRKNFYMEYILLPFVYVLTLGLFPLFLYWYTNLYVYCMFDQINQTSFNKMIATIIEKRNQQLSNQRERDLIIEEGHEYLGIKVPQTKPIDIREEKEMLTKSISHILIENEKNDP